MKFACGELRSRFAIIFGGSHLSYPLAVTRKNHRVTAVTMLDFFDRCAFLALLHPPLAGTPTAVRGGEPRLPQVAKRLEGAARPPVGVGALDDPSLHAVFISPDGCWGEAGARGWTGGRGTP